MPARTAFVLYGRILDEVERSGYPVVDRRVAVPHRARISVAPAQAASGVCVRRPKLS
ncbi:hypothetical protein ACFWCF_22960 [Rhodococcus sp. NPDC060090]|uniref:hypothetical protein n=1 Tax=Rhodococcus sp. NPDC060090 TaxID=3347056 RepID=UPI00365E1899